MAEGSRRSPRQQKKTIYVPEESDCDEDNNMEKEVKVQESASSSDDSLPKPKEEMQPKREVKGEEEAVAYPVESNTAYDEETKTVYILYPRGNVYLCPYPDCDKKTTAVRHDNRLKWLRTHCKKHTIPESNIRSKCRICLKPLAKSNDESAHHCIVKTCKYCGHECKGVINLTNHEDNCVRQNDPLSPEALEIIAEQVDTWDPTDTRVEPNNDGDILLLMYPHKKHLECPVDECGYDTAGNNDTCIRKNFLDHLVTIHVNKGYTKSIVRCRTCNDSLSGKSGPSSIRDHPCRQQANVDAGKYTCSGNGCPEEPFTTKTGLIAHEKACLCVMRAVKRSASDIDNMVQGSSSGIVNPEKTRRLDLDQDDDMDLDEEVETEEAMEVDMDPDETVYEKKHEGPLADSTKKAAEAAEAARFAKVDYEFYLGQLDHLLYKIPDDTSAWNDFCKILEKILELVRIHYHIQLDAPANPRPPPDTSNHSQIQKLFIRKKTAAYRLITEKESPKFSMHPEVARDQVKEKLKQVDCKNHSQIITPESQKPRPISDTVFISEAIISRLKKCRNTAPGPDRLTYKHWLGYDEDAKLLFYIFAICQKHRKIPDTWKQSKTVMIPKKENPSQEEIGDWREIYLYNTIYKLYNGLINDRLVRWLENKYIFDEGIKAYRHCDGVFEIVQYLDITKRNAFHAGKEYYAVFLDISAAFPSICHHCAIKALTESGCGDAIVPLVEDMLTGCITTVLSTEGNTNAIDIGRGLSVGLPLSGTLFNLVMNPIFKNLNGSENSQRNLIGYSDDWLALANSARDMQDHLDTIHDELGIRNLSTNVDKTVFRYLHPTNDRRTPGKLYLGGQEIFPIDANTEHNFLGCPMHFLKDSHVKEIMNDLKEKFDKIEGSRLTECQKLVALITIVYPIVRHYIKHLNIEVGFWHKLDDTVRPIIRKCMCLRKDAANAFIHGESKTGCLGLPCFGDLYYIYKVDNFFKLLTSSDTLLTQYVRDELLKKYLPKSEHQNPDDKTWEKISDFLSGTNKRKKSTNTQSCTMLTKCAAASKMLKITWKITSDSVSIKDSKDKEYMQENKEDRKMIVKSLTAIKREEHFQELLIKCKFQGKVFHSIQKDWSSSYFMRHSTDYLHAVYRFAMRARLGLLAQRGRLYNANPFCRHKCVKIDKNNEQQGVIETLGHILGGCDGDGAASKYHQRHNSICELVKRRAVAAGFTILLDDEMIESLVKKPDLVICKDKKVYIIDVSLTFESEYRYLTDRYEEKAKKYQDVVNKYKKDKHYTDATAYGLVLGALGSWCLLNRPVLDPLFNTKYQKKWFKRDCVRLALEGSYFAYQHHMRPSELHKNAQLTTRLE